MKRAATRKIKKASYLIHNNGTRPFKVAVSGKTVEIYKGPDYKQLVKKLVVKEVYVGKYGGATGLGNSILLNVSGNKYMHIGFDIYEFSMDDEVDAYYSLIGNSDVPYPVLLGTKNVYFMLDHSYLPRTFFKTPKVDWEDAYQYYYGYKDPETGDNCDPEQRAKVKKQRAKLEKKMKGLKILSLA
jgi:hypothetical protein